jgi:ribosomal protein S18 acetylase RimI-like enzyme
MILRPAGPADVAAVGAVHVESRRAAYAGLVADEALDAVPAEAMAAWWAERYRWEGDTHRLVVAVAGGEVVGFTYTGPSEVPDAGELYAIHVLPEHQGTGIGRALMVDALTALTAHGARAVLWVLDGNAHARRFYERGGWTADGEVREAPIGPATTRQLRYARILPRQGGST